MKVRKAVIPAAGLGTRFLPATKAQPKEMIPIVDKPGIQYTVEEAARAGITEILVVTSLGKGSMEDHFDRALLLEANLERTGKKEELAEVRRLADLANVHTVRQKEPLGFGHAVLMGKSFVGDDPFAVMVPDEIVPEPPSGERSLLDQMVEIFERTGSSVITVQQVPRDEVTSYGIVDPEFAEEDLARIVTIVEKPEPDEAPSDLGARGRYVLSPDIFDALERTKPGWGDEIQLTDAINLLAQEQTVYAYVHRGPIYDVGRKLDYLRATVELALRRDDLAEPFMMFLTEVAGRKD
jgi:UTP--glucose-1-phosphate uridylyltransferase